MKERGEWLAEKFKKSKLAGNRLVVFAVELVRRYSAHNVSESGALLAYFFLFALFPSIIFFNSLIGILEINPMNFLQQATLIPADIIKIISDFLLYIENKSSFVLMLTGLVLTLYFFSRAARSLMSALEKALGVTKRRPFLRRILVSVFITLGLIGSVFVGIFTIVLGKNLLSFVGNYVPFLVRYFDVWWALRIVIITGYFVITTTLLYMVVPSERLKFSEAIYGTLFALPAWLGVSYLFSLYVEQMGNYSALYGSIGAIMVLMLWLYITGIVLVLGGEVNGIIRVMGGESVEGGTHGA